MHSIFKDGMFDVIGAGISFPDKVELEDLFRDHILVKMMSDSVIVDDRKYQVMQSAGWSSWIKE